MLFRQLFDQVSSTYTYLIAADFNTEAIIIDPVLEHTPLYIQLIEELGLKLKYSIETHTHADHITGSGRLRQKIGCDIIMGRQSKAKHVTRHIDDGEIIEFAAIQIRAIYTPGHTDDCYCYALPDRVFTGDTLLIRGTGRTDFQSGNAEQAYASITKKLLTLPEETLVYPAHNYKGITVSSIYEEKRFNPRLQAKTGEAYAEIMNHLNLEKPKLIDIAVPANLECGMNVTEA